MVKGGNIGIIDPLITTVRILVLIKKMKLFPAEHRQEKSNDNFSNEPTARYYSIIHTLYPR